MEITTVTYKRTLRANLGNYEHDERSCELTAKVDPGEDAEGVIERLFSLIATAISGEFGEPGAPVVDTHVAHPGLDQQLRAEQAFGPAIDAGRAKAEAVILGGAPSTPAEPPVLTEEVFRVELAAIAKVKGASAIVNALAAHVPPLERASQLSPAERRPFIDSLKG